MIHLFVTEAEAMALRAQSEAAGNWTAVAVIDLALRRVPPQLATTVLPELSVWYRGHASHYFDETLADVMFERLQGAREDYLQATRDALPLFAEEIES